MEGWITFEIRKWKIENSMNLKETSENWLLEWQKERVGLNSEETCKTSIMIM